MNYRVYDLSCDFDARQNFYGKAKVKVYTNGDEDLISYNTVVATKRNNTIKINGWYSQTTGRHIREYMNQYGFNDITKKDMQEDREFKVGV